jgi:wyosine [tRNA(Phe)-imidazoG37] synthetase (radical SAM superfamily)
MKSMDLHMRPVYGPELSVRLGRSLGVNLAPGGTKACTFNCAYCEYGWTNPPVHEAWPHPASVIEAVDRALVADNEVDHITVKGNGEPTLHPAFATIVEGLVKVRTRRAPRARLAILSNGSMVHRLDVKYSLPLFDDRYMKLDAGDATTLLRVNACSLPLERLIANIASVNDIVLQSTFVRDGTGYVDNTTPLALDAWLDAVRVIRPSEVHVDTLDRNLAQSRLLRVDRPTLEAIAARVNLRGIRASVLA